MSSEFCFKLPTQKEQLDMCKCFIQNVFDENWNSSDPTVQVRQASREVYDLNDIKVKSMVYLAELMIDINDCLFLSGQDFNDIFTNVIEWLLEYYDDDNQSDSSNEVLLLDRVLPETKCLDPIVLLKSYSLCHNYNSRYSNYVKQILCKRIKTSAESDNVHSDFTQKLLKVCKEEDEKKLTLMVEEMIHTYYPKNPFDCIDW